MTDELIEGPDGTLYDPTDRSGPVIRRRPLKQPSVYTREQRAEAAHILKRIADLLIAETWESEAPLTAVADARLRAGMREYEGHPDHWDGWGAERFAFNVLQEILDGSNYLCESLARGQRDVLLESLGLRP